MADNGEGVADSCSSRKRKADGDDTSGNPKRPFIKFSDDESDSDDDYIFHNATLKVKTPTGKIIYLEVKPSDTVGSIKVKIQDQEHIPFGQQELFFEEVALTDMDTIANLRVKKDSIITLMRVSTGFINISINSIEDNTTQSYKVKPHDTIGSIKSKSFEYSWALFIFNDVVLGDDGTFADFNIIDGSTITHIDRDAKRMKIFVNSYTGKTFSVLVDPTHTISLVKETIETTADIPREEQVLIYDNMVLGDKGTVFDFNIIRKSTLTLMHKPKGMKGFMRIFIKTITGETFTLGVKSSYNVSKIKDMLEDMVDVPCDEQELIFNEMVLNDSNTLADFHITNESTLTLMRISNGLMRIFVKCNDNGETMALNVAPSDSIHDVKSKILKIKRRSSLPLEHIMIFKEKQLEDTATLAHYGISKDSTVYFSDCC